MARIGNFVYFLPRLPCQKARIAHPVHPSYEGVCEIFDKVRLRFKYEGCYVFFKGKRNYSPIIDQ